MISTNPVSLHHVCFLYKASFYPKFAPLFLPLALPFSVQMFFPISPFHFPPFPHLVLSLSPMAPFGSSHLSNNQQLLMQIPFCLSEHNNGPSIKANFTPIG